MSIGKPFVAIDVYEKALHLNPAHSHAMAGLAKVYRNLQIIEKQNPYIKGHWQLNTAVYESLAPLVQDTSKKVMICLRKLFK